MEVITYLDVVDQFRYILGMVSAYFVFFYNTAPKRNNFKMRLIAGGFCCLAASFGYIGLLILYEDQRLFETYTILGIVYWLMMTFLVIGYMMFCYQIPLGPALFRGSMAGAMEGLVTVVLKYVIVTMLLPDLPEKYTLGYILLSITVYAVIYAAVYHILAKKVQESRSADTLNNRKTVWIYILVITLFSLINDASKGIAEWIVKPMEEYEHMENIIRTIQTYSIGVMMLVCLIILLIQYYVYEIAVLQNEKSWFQHLLTERKLQYEHSKSNIDIINQKCHELKRRIIELEKATGSERQEMIQETKKAVMFYDSVVKTSNEVLNTILTEKSLYCANSNINLTCMVNAEHLSDIEGIDLYTILENALDNAITCAEGLKEKGKKSVAISIYERGKMLYMSVENYYENPIALRNGIPVSRKKSSGRYGMGLQTIRMIAKKYGGDMRVTMEDQIFILQIVLPVSGMKKQS